MTKRKPYTDADIAEVSDNPEWTKEDFATAKPFAEVFPELAESFRRSRGPQKKPTKLPISIRLSREVVEHYKATGSGWQAKIDSDLRKLIKRRA